MANQETRKTATISRAIDAIEENVKAICSQAQSDSERLEPSTILIDDSNVHLQKFFHRLEEILILDLKNQKYGHKTNKQRNKRSYWAFFSTALKEGKGLYETVLYVLNCNEVKTPSGRGRLFIRFCLQHHRLGDVIQFSFSLPKVVNKFFTDDCFWSNSTNLNRIVQTLYLLNDIKFNLFTSSQYQLDVSWPTVDSKFASTESTTRTRYNSGSTTFLNSADSESMFSTSVPNTLSMVDPTLISESSDDEDPENTVAFWKEKYQQLLEAEKPNPVSKQDFESQCSFEDPTARIEIEILQSQLNALQHQVTSLNLQLLALSNENSNTDREIREYTHLIAEYRQMILSRDKEIAYLKENFQLGNETIDSMKHEHSSELITRDEQVTKLQEHIDKLFESLRKERTSIDEERKSFQTLRQRLEQQVQEKTLDCDEMKRHLMKAVNEKAELFKSIHNYELKLEEERSKRWEPDEKVHKCTKCKVSFTWTVRKHHCRECHKIFCNNCSNHWLSSSASKGILQRVCDWCNEKLFKEDILSNPLVYHEVPNQTSIMQDVSNDFDVHFEVRSEQIHSNDKSS